MELTFVSQPPSLSEIRTVLSRRIPEYTYRQTATFLFAVHSPFTAAKISVNERKKTVSVQEGRGARWVLLLEGFLMNLFLRGKRTACAQRVYQTLVDYYSG